MPEPASSLWKKEVLVGVSQGLSAPDESSGCQSLPRGVMFLARSAQAATVARFSAMVIVRQAPISLIVLRQPIQSPLARSMVQTLTHGEATTSSSVGSPAAGGGGSVMRRARAMVR